MQQILSEPNRGGRAEQCRHLQTHIVQDLRTVQLALNCVLRM